MEVLSKATLGGSVKGSPKEDMVVSDGGIMEGKKRKRKGGKELTEKVPVSDGKSGRRFSAQRLASGRIETKQVGLCGKARIRTNYFVGEKARRCIEIFSLSGMSEVVQQESSSTQEATGLCQPQAHTRGI